MSAAGATPTAPLVVGAFKRAATATAYRWELRKLVSQKRTYLGFGLAIVLPLIFVVVQSLRHNHDRGENIFASQITHSGLATPVLMLLSAAVATVAGVAAWGFNSVTTYSGTVVSPSEGLLLIFAANICYLIPLFAVASIGVLLSTVTRNSAAAVVGAVGVTILLFIIGQIPGLEGIRPYLLTEQYEAWHGLLRTPTDWAPIWHSLWVCALYAGPALLAGYLVFLRRDVAGG